MFNGGFLTLDFSELELSVVKPTSGEASNIDLTRMPTLRKQWKAIDGTKPVVIYNFWMDHAYHSGYAFITINNNVITLYFSCAIGAFEISVAENTMTVAMA